jgi:hypothetical protein
MGIATLNLQVETKKHLFFGQFSIQSCACEPELVRKRTLRANLELFEIQIYAI